MFTKTPKEIIESHIDVEAVHSNALFRMEESKDVGIAENGVFTAIVDEVADSSWGWRTHIPLATVFGYELNEEEKEDVEQSTSIREEIDNFAQDCAVILKEETGLPGDFYFGEHESDGSYCLFYQEKAIA